MSNPIGLKRLIISIFRSPLSSPLALLLFFFRCLSFSRFLKFFPIFLLLSSFLFRVFFSDFLTFSSYLSRILSLSSIPSIKEVFFFFSSYLSFRFLSQRSPLFTSDLPALRRASRQEGRIPPSSPG